MLRRAGTLLAKQLSQTRSHSNKARFLCGMLPSKLLSCCVHANDKTVWYAVGAVWASFDLERIRRHLPACSGFQARRSLTALNLLLYILRRAAFSGALTFACRVAAAALHERLLEMKLLASTLEPPTRVWLSWRAR